MLKGIPPKTRAVCLTAAILLILLAGHLLTTGTAQVQWRTAAYDGKGRVEGSENLYVPAPHRQPAEEDYKSGREGYRESAFGSSSMNARPTADERPPAHAPPASVATPFWSEDDDGELPCQNLPGAEDIVVIMRTGATEIRDKLPVHLRTTFKCYSDLLIFSDFEEEFMGHHVHDVLRTMDPKVVEQNDDFELYNRLKNHGRAGLHIDELSGKASFEGSKSGKNDNAGWRLDKWKFLPMMVETHRLRPDKKFYVFVESDSYVVWSNLLRWLQTVDSKKPFYAGSEVQIGPDVFAHGGSVFVMTNPALRVGAELYQRDPQTWDAWTARHWAGDCVLGKALKDNGVGLTWSWPMFQGGQPEKMDYSETKDELLLWCVPALSYHHFSPIEMKRMWDFEQAWLKSHGNDSEGQHHRGWFESKDYSNVLHHGEVFQNYIWPNLTAETPEWNNLSPDRVPESEGSTFEECRSLCEKNVDCMQFNQEADGCWISTKNIMLGQPWGDVKSGWMVDRIEAWMRRLDTCGGRDGWTVP